MRILPSRRDLLPLIVVDEATKGDDWLEGRTKLTKLVFLAQRETEPAVIELIRPDEPFQFVPYNYGPFSSELLADLEEMERRGLVEISHRPLDSTGTASEFLYRPTEEGRRVAQSAEPAEAAHRVRALVAGYARLSRNRLVRYIYERYPDAAPSSRPQTS